MSDGGNEDRISIEWGDIGVREPELDAEEKAETEVWMAERESREGVAAVEES